MPGAGTFDPMALGQTIVAAAAQHGVLRAQRAVHYLERRAHVVIEAAHQARLHFESEFRDPAETAARRRNAGRMLRTGDPESTAACR